MHVIGDLIGDLMRLSGDIMRFYRDFMRFNGDLMGLNGIKWRVFITVNCLIIHVKYRV